MSRLARALALAAMLATVTMAGMTTVAHAQPSNDPASTRQHAPRRVESLAADQPSGPAVATVRRLLARERFAIPDPAPAHPRLLLDEERSSLLNLPGAGAAQAPSPVRPAGHSGRPGWLAPALSALTVGLALGGGVAVLATRRANRVQRAGQTACPTPTASTTAPTP